MIDLLAPATPDGTGDRDESQLGGTAVAAPRPWWKSHAALATALAAYAYLATVLSAAAYLSLSTPQGVAGVGFVRAVVWQGLVYGLWIPFGLGLLFQLERRRTVSRGLIVLGAATVPCVVLHAALASVIDVSFSPTRVWGDFPGLFAARLPIDIAIWTMIAASLLALIWRGRASAEADQVRRLRQALIEARRGAVVDEGLPSRISVSAGRRKILVDLGDVERFSSAANYVVVHWQDREGLVREPLKQLEQRLDPRLFMRVHRSSVVNLAHVADAAPLDDGSWRLRMTSGAEVILSRSYRDAFLQRIGVRRGGASTDPAGAPS